MPDDAAVEKQQELEARGAVVKRVRPVSISHPEHMVHQARRAAGECPGGFFADQFENLDNAEAHIQTGEEIWQQCRGKVDAFVCGSGTGGTIAGVSKALKSRHASIKVVLVDPPGSSLYLKVRCTYLSAPCSLGSLIAP
jgi:cysteine synthase